jgi:hypothetical protein
MNRSVGILVLAAFAVSCRHRVDRLPPGEISPARDISGAWTLNRRLSDPVGPGDEPVENIVMTLDASKVTFLDADGSRRVYHLSNRADRQDFGKHATTTKTRWDGSTLRQEIRGDGGLRCVQTFSVDRLSRRLIVTTMPDARRLPMSRVRLVYNRSSTALRNNCS